MASMGEKLKLCLPILLLLVLHQGQAENAWDGVISGLPELDGLGFRDQVATPLVQMSANAYRFPGQVCVDIPGWVLSPKVAPLAPAEGGVHAQVYEVSKSHIRVSQSFLTSKLVELDLCSNTTSECYFISGGGVLLFGTMSLLEIRVSC